MDKQSFFAFSRSVLDAVPAFLATPDVFSSLVYTRLFLKILYLAHPVICLMDVVSFIRTCLAVRVQYVQTVPKMNTSHFICTCKVIITPRHVHELLRHGLLSC